MATTTDLHAPFLADIIANPDDDTPRLIFADWLEERGGRENTARAEFIRVQCRLPVVVSSLDPAHHFVSSQAKVCRSPKCEPCRLRRREKALLKKWLCEWNREFYGVIAEAEVAEALATGKSLRRDYRSPPLACEFRRGFVDSVSMALEDWHRHGLRLVRQSPLRSVRISDREPWVALHGGEDASWWCEATVGDGPGALPLWIFSQLQGGYLDDIEEFREYDTSEDAHVALSSACLRLARQENH